MNMKKQLICTLAILSLSSFVQAQEAEPEASGGVLPSLELSFDHTSRYMSEGNVGNPDGIETIGLTAEWEVSDILSLHLGGTAIYDETDACDNRHNVEEWDWKAGLTLSLKDLPGLGTLECTCDYIYYNYPHDGVHTHNTDTKEYEIDVNATDLFLSPGFAFVHDFENDVIKANFNLTYEADLAMIMENLSFECPVEFWVGNHQYTGSTSSTAVYSLCAQPTLSFELNEHLSLATYLQMGWALDSRVRRDWKEDENNNAFNVCWGLNLTLKF